MVFRKPFSFNEESFQKSEMIHLIFAEGPGVAREKKNLKKILKECLTYVNPKPFMSVHKTFQSIQSSRLAGPREIYTNVLFYCIDN